MDIDFLRTFLEVKRTKHFAQAAKAMFVSQSTISARIRLLEEELQTRLFTRTRNDIQLTEAGKALVPQAEAMVTLWEQARRSLAPAQLRPLLRLGSTPALWPLLQPLWQEQLQQPQPTLLLAGEALSPQGLAQGLLSQQLDLALAWGPPPSPELKGQLLATRELQLVSGRAGLSWEEAQDQTRLEVLWETEPTRGQKANPDQRTSLSLAPGPWIKELLLQTNACAYLPLNWVAEDVTQGRLHPVLAAPPLTCQVYAWTHQKPQQAEALQGIWERLWATKNCNDW